MPLVQNAMRNPTGFFIATMQKASAAFFGLLVRCWGGIDARITLPPLDPHKRYVIASNHLSYVDPFSIYAPMTFKQRKNLAPVRFMMKPSLYHLWWLKPFVWALGAYPAHIKQRHHHTYGVEGSIKLLGMGYNICIFPEGKLSRRETSEPKSGIVRILEAYPDAQLLLAHIEWPRRKNGRGKHYLQLRVVVAPDNLDRSDPKAIMDAIYRL